MTDMEMGLILFRSAQLMGQSCAGVVQTARVLAIRIVLGRLGTRSTELYDLSILRIWLGLLFFLEP